MLNIAIDNRILIGLAGVVIFVILGIVVSIFLKDRKQDQEEIEELMNDLGEIDPKKVKEVEFVEKKSEIEELLEKMQKDMEARTEDVVETFEKDQEEKSIISYQELLKTLQKETTPMVDPIETKKIQVATLGEDTFVEEPVVLMKEETPAIQESIKKFKNSEFISPVYGKMNEHLEYPTVPSFNHQEQLDLEISYDHSNVVTDVLDEFDRQLDSHNIDDYLADFNFDNHMRIDSLEQTLDMPPISAEVKQNEEFLQALKDFRKNLE